MRGRPHRFSQALRRGGALTQPGCDKRGVHVRVCVRVGGCARARTCDPSGARSSTQSAALHKARQHPPPFTPRAPSPCSPAAMAEQAPGPLPLHGLGIVHCHSAAPRQSSRTWSTQPLSSSCFHARDLSLALSLVCASHVKGVGRRATVRRGGPVAQGPAHGTRPGTDPVSREAHLLIPRSLQPFRAAHGCATLERGASGGWHARRSPPPVCRRSVDQSGGGGGPLR